MLSIALSLSYQRCSRIHWSEAKFRMLPIIDAQRSQIDWQLLGFTREPLNVCFESELAIQSEPRSNDCYWVGSGQAAFGRKSAKVDIGSDICSIIPIPEPQISFDVGSFGSSAHNDLHEKHAAYRKSIAPIANVLFVGGGHHIRLLHIVQHAVSRCHFTSPREYIRCESSSPPLVTALARISLRQASSVHAPLIALLSRVGSML